MGEPASADGFQRRRARSRAALLDAAIALFQARGLRAVRLEEICAHAGVSPRTFFNHFATREHLYQAIAQQRAQQLAEVLDATAADPRPLPERLRRLFAEVARYLAARPPYRELVAEMLALRGEHGSAIARRDVLGLAARRLVEDGIARREICGRHPPAALADLMLGALTTALTNWCADDGFDLERGLAEAAEALLDLFTPEAKEP